MTPLQGITHYVSANGDSQGEVEVVRKLLDVDAEFL
jgi:hypothetical protein